MTDFENDINDYVPSLLSPRTERIDPLSQSTQKAKLQLSLKKRQGNSTKYSERNSIFTSTQAQKRGLPLECDISPIKKISIFPLLESDENSNAEKSYSNLPELFVNVTDCNASSQILLNNSQSLMSQDLRYCKNCQLPKPPNDHESNCTGPNINYPECVKGDKCYSSVVSHFMKNKHSLLSKLRTELTRQLNADNHNQSKQTNVANNNKTTGQMSNNHNPSLQIATRSKTTKGKYNVNADHQMQENKNVFDNTTQEINIHRLNGMKSNIYETSNTESKKPLQNKIIKNNIDAVIDLTLSSSKRNRGTTQHKISTSTTLKKATNKYVDDSPSKLHFRDTKISSSKKVSRNLFSKNRQLTNKLQKENGEVVESYLSNTKTNKEDRRITRSQIQKQAAEKLPFLNVNVMTHIPEKLDDLENWFSKHSSSNSASSSTTNNNPSEKNPSYEFEDILRIPASDSANELIDSIGSEENSTVIFDKCGSSKTIDCETKNVEPGCSSFANDCPVLSVASKEEAIYQIEAQKMTKTMPYLANTSHNDSFITCTSELNQTNEKSSVKKDEFEFVHLSQESCKSCEPGTGNIQFILNGAGSSDSTIVLNAEVTSSGWQAVTIDTSNQINLENNGIQLCKCKKNLKISCTTTNSKAKGKILKVTKKPQKLNLSRKLNVNLLNRDNLDKSVNITTLTQTSIASFFRTKNIPPSVTDLNISHQSSQTEIKTNNDSDSDIEIVDWDIKCKPKLDNIIKKAKECNLNLNYTSAPSTCDDTNSLDSVSSVSLIRVKSVENINNSCKPNNTYFPNNSLTTIKKRVIKTKKKTRIKRDPSKPKQKKICPPEKLIEDTPFAVDAFTYGAIDNVEIYFLTHYHADHYMGLTKKFDKPLYCSQVTANLVMLNIKTSKSYINIIEPFTTKKLFGIDVTALPANHCPGSIMLLFTLEDGRNILHTGDFRADASMQSYRYLCNQPKIYTLHLDTTYCNPSYKFPPQRQSIEMAVKKTSEWINLNKNHQNLIVVGAYTIGKELIWVELCKKFNMTVWVDKARRKNLHALEDTSYIQYLEEDPLKASIHVLGLGNLSYDYLCEYLGKFKGHFKRILALKPSGWQYFHKPSIRGHITIVGIPYSEHSSYTELCSFVGFLRPEKILATAGNQQNLNRLLQDAGKPEKTVNTIDKYLIPKI